MTELLNCPFCGGKAAPYQEFPQEKWARILCECGACGPDVRTGYQEVGWQEDAAREWNTRVDLWQPIETAPKDETLILFAMASGVVWQGYWKLARELQTPHGAVLEEAGWTRFNCLDHGLEPVKWQPMPSLPTAQQEGNNAQD